MNGFCWFPRGRLSAPPKMTFSHFVVKETESYCYSCSRWASVSLYLNIYLETPFGKPIFLCLKQDLSRKPEVTRSWLNLSREILHICCYWWSWPISWDFTDGWSKQPNLLRFYYSTNYVSTRCFASDTLVGFEGHRSHFGEPWGFPPEALH